MEGVANAAHLEGTLLEEAVPQVLFEGKQIPLKGATIPILNEYFLGAPLTFKDDFIDAVGLVPGPIPQQGLMTLGDGQTICRALIDSVTTDERALW
jgi:hypothetical protein